MTKREWRWGEGPAEVLLLHGFSGVPSDLRYLGDRLHAAGFAVRAPALPGHGPEAARLGEVRARDWQEAGRAVLREMREANDGPIAVVGFSLGGALAAYLAATSPDDVKSLVLLAPALGLTGSSHLYRQLFRYPLASRLVPRVKKGPPNISPGSLPLDRGATTHLPTSAAVLVDQMIRDAREVVDGVRSPTLVFWGAGDGVVPRTAAEEAARRIGAPLVVLPNSRHHLGLDPDRERLADELLAFLGEAAVPTPLPAAAEG